MSKRIILFLFLSLVVLSAEALAQTTEFSYQGRLSVVFVNAFKEQQAQIETQQQRIKQQQQQIDGLKKIVCGLQPQAEICQ